MASTIVNSSLSLTGQIAAGSSDLRTDTNKKDSFGMILRQIGTAADLSSTTGSKTILNTNQGTRTDLRAGKVYDSSQKTDTQRQSQPDKVSDKTGTAREDDTGKTTDVTGDKGNITDGKNTNVRDDHKTTPSGKDDKDVDTDTNAAGAADEADDTDDAEKIIDAGAQQLIELIADLMGVTDEQVSQVMKDNGIDAGSLFDTDNMTKLVSSLGGDGDSASLLTDENLLSDLNTLKEDSEKILGKISDELGISVDEIKEMIGSNTSDQTQKLVTDESGTQTQNTPNNENITDQMQSLTGMKDYTNRQSESGGKQIEVKVTVDDQSGQKTFNVVTQTVQDSDTETDGNQKQDSMFGNSAGKGHGTTDADSAKEIVNNAASFTDNLSRLVNNASTAGATSQAAESTTQTSAAQAQDIFDQIADYMKVQMKSDTSTLDIRLHPENLGTVNVHLTEKQGTLTAEFTTQNEAVKAAVESQLMQLKEQFEEQGIKVSAVEVSVAEQKFGRNDQDSGKRSGEDENGGKVRSRTRRINLTESDEDEDETDESEQIVADMMERNGNKIDYTV